MRFERVPEGFARPAVLAAGWRLPDTRLASRRGQMFAYDALAGSRAPGRPQIAKQAGQSAG